jgi:hypothetical protein
VFSSTVAAPGFTSSLLFGSVAHILCKWILLYKMLAITFSIAAGLCVLLIDQKTVLFLLCVLSCEYYKCCFVPFYSVTLYSVLAVVIWDWLRFHILYLSICTPSSHNQFCGIKSPRVWFIRLVWLKDCLPTVLSSILIIFLSFVDYWCLKYIIILRNLPLVCGFNFGYYCCCVCSDI